MVTSTNDCILRARTQAEYVASADVDEVFFTLKKSLLDILDAERREPSFKKPGAFLIRHRFARLLASLKEKD